MCDWLLIRRIFASCAAGLLTIVEIPFDEKTQTFMSQIGGHFATAPLPQMVDSLAAPLSMRADPYKKLMARESNGLRYRWSKRIPNLRMKWSWRWVFSSLAPPSHCGLQLTWLKWPLGRDGRNGRIRPMRTLDGYTTLVVGTLYGIHLTLERTWCAETCFIRDGVLRFDVPRA